MCLEVRIMRAIPTPAQGAIGSIRPPVKLLAIAAQKWCNYGTDRPS